MEEPILRERSCVACGSADFERLLTAQDYEYGLQGEFVVSRCSACGLVQQTPRPDFSVILGYYPDGYTAFEMQPRGLVGRLKHAAIMAPRLATYRKVLRPGARILDVGCGSGALLDALHRDGGWQAVGVEINPEAVRIGREAGLDLRLGSLEDAAFPDNSFDLVVLNHVLEHVHEPRATLREILRILAPGGVLMGEVPNLRCLEHAMFGKYWAGYHLPRHITFFDDAQLRSMLGGAGFDVQATKGKMQPANLLVSLSNWLRAEHPRVAARNFVGENSFIGLSLNTPVAFVANLLGSSPSLRFVARKPARANGPAYERAARHASTLRAGFQR